MNERTHFQEPPHVTISRPEPVIILPATMKSEILQPFPRPQGKLLDLFSRRPRVSIAVFIFLALVSLFSLQPTTSTERSLQIPQPPQPPQQSQNHKGNQKLHILLPTTNGDVNLCKTVLSGRAAGYSNPTLIGWNDTHDTWYLLGGGSHIAKVSKVLEWLQDRKPEEDDDLVLMMDAFDIWMQLRPETLIQRYHAINAAANARIAAEMGKAAEIEGIKQTIVFGAGKRCAPNQPHTIACYSVPKSPLPKDIYGGNTDTLVGRNRFASHRQKFLNSGYVIGPVGDMRRMFKKTWDKVQKWPNHDPDDNGSGSSDFMYHGSDQAAFAALFGEQEYQRAVMTRRHAGWTQKARGWGKGDGELYKNEGAVIGEDVLDPPFTHETMEPLDGKPCEFGIGLDYFSELGHQTANAEHDGMWLRYSDPLEDILNQTETGRNKFDCRYKGNGKLPVDLARSAAPSPAGGWDQVELFTNICLDKVPAMVHHNGDKSLREKMWTRLWSQSYLKDLVEKSKEKKDGQEELGAMAYGHRFIGYDELCPSNFADELFKIPGQKPKQEEVVKENEKEVEDKKKVVTEMEKIEDRKEAVEEKEKTEDKKEGEKSEGKKEDVKHVHQHEHQEVGAGH